VIAAAASDDAALEAHDLRTRHAGPVTFIEFHLVMPGETTVEAAHDLCDRIEAALMAALPGARVTIHVEPEHKAKADDPGYQGRSWLRKSEMENLRGSILMVLSMGGFALEDMFIKRLADTLPVGQIILLIGVGGALIFGAITRAQGGRLWSRDLVSRPVILRNFGELLGTLGFVMAIALTPLSSASAILQATPLAVTLGAALFLGEAVGWRRWAAILVGFCGVLMVIRPGMAGFEPASLFAVLAVFGLAARDLATRAVPRTISSMQLSTYAFATLVPTGVILLAFHGTPAVPSAVNWRDLALALLCGVSAYYAIVAAMRLGDVAVITPFRYSRLVFALIIGVTLFDERPDVWTLAGAGIIIASGIYTFWRERRLARRMALA
jgi:drug/metabolite transporter (DMT)-like permease